MKFIIKHGSENAFLQNSNSKVKFSSSLLKVKNFKNEEEANETLNFLNSQKNVAKPYTLVSL